MALNNPIFVLEGGDGTGKTTLANEIVRLTGAHYLHLTYAKHLVGNMLEYQTDAMRAAIELSKFFPVVIDRWLPSEYVYAHAFRDGKVEIDELNATQMLEDLAGECVYVFCHPESRTEYLEAFNKLKQEREEMYNTAAGIYHEYSKYIVGFATRDLTTYTYDRFKRSANSMALTLIGAHVPAHLQGKTK